MVQQNKTGIVTVIHVTIGLPKTNRRMNNNLNSVRFFKNVFCGKRVFSLE